MTLLPSPTAAASRLAGIETFSDLVAYLRDDLEWEIPELPIEKLTYSYTADELGLKLDAQVEITQLRPILGQKNPWGVFFVDFDRADLPVTLLRRILSGVSRKKRSSADPADRAMFDKNDLLFVSAFGKAEDRRLALAHFHQEPGTAALPTLRVVSWDRQDTPRHMMTVAERLNRLRWPSPEELPESWKDRWSKAFVDRPHDAVRTAKQMAESLAACAKQIRVAIQEILPKEKPGQPLTLLFEAVKATLNKDLDGPKFADTYAQTVAYGLLSKRIDQVQRWRAEKARTLDGDLPLPPITVDALETAIPTNPFLSELLNSFLTAGGRDRAGAGLDFDELGLGDLIHLLNSANMEAVLDDFDKDKQGDDPVIHFYEGFLDAYDKAMKVQRGVFYTPKPVVSFIVRSVDEVLRTDFGLEDGLADIATWGEFVAKHPTVGIPVGTDENEPFVKVLDPATGTGTFLVEAIEVIHRRLWDFTWGGKSEAEKQRLWNVWVPQHLLPRLYGYELMMAPYAVAHLKIGLKLADTGYDFSGVEVGANGKPHQVRARVFLTNTLEAAHDLDMQLTFMNEALAHEAKAANDAKARDRFTVIMGNPPYANYGQVNRNAFAIELVRRYKAGLQEKKLNLDDDYIKFLAFAEDTITKAGVGVLGMITNSSFLDGIVHREMRHSLSESFHRASFIDLHGNARRHEMSPDGSQDENVFDIQQGVAVSILSTQANRSLSRADVWGSRDHKSTVMLGATARSLASVPLQPKPPAYAFTPEAAGPVGEYDAFPSVVDTFAVIGSGLKTDRDELCIDFDRPSLIQRMNKFFSGKYDDNFSRQYNLYTTSSYDPVKAAASVRFSSEYVRKFVSRPFDERWIYYQRGFTSRPVFHVQGNMLQPNVGLLFARQTKDQFDVLAIDKICTHKIVTAYDNTSLAPLFIYAGVSDDPSVLKIRSCAPNLRQRFTDRVEMLTDLRFDDGLDTPAQENLPGMAPPPAAQASLPLRRERGDLRRSFGARDVFDWIYAVLHAPTYRERYSAFLTSDYPRIPLPKNCAVFAEMIPLGTRLVALHLLDAAVVQVLADPSLRFVNNGGEARAGRFGKELRRDEAGRVYLNDRCWFATVSKGAWEHWIGGYQPAQKWLKERAERGSKDKLEPGRLLSDDDILHYRRMIVALDETANVMTEIDQVINRHGGWPDAFKGMTD